MAKCDVCKKNATQKRIVTDGICNECSKKQSINYDDAPCNPNDTLGTIKFKDFVEWMVVDFAKHVKDSVTAELADCRRELAETKKDLAKTRQELTQVKADITSMNGKMKALSEDHEKTKKCTSDNLRYLINHDRNVRQRNVLLFGLPDDEEIKLGNDTFDSDRAAVEHIFERLEVENDVKLTEFFRLGKKVAREEDAEEEPKPRPVKICFKSSNMAKVLMSSRMKLKDMFGEDVSIYIKPDKTKSERDEFTRLGKKKQELMEHHPTPVGENPRVVLKNGRLLVDNAEIDSYKTPQTLF